MDTKRAALKAVLANTTDDQRDEPLMGAIDALSKKFDAMIRLMDDQVHLQKVALLDAGHILRLHGPEGQSIALSLPEAQDDFIQRVILRTRGFYEAKLLQMVRDKGIVGHASTVCDVGANIGNHSVFFSKIMGAARVLSYEPQIHTHSTLCTNIELNGLSDRVVAYNCMLGAETGLGQLAKFNPRNLGGTEFVGGQGGEVPMFALDDAISTDDLTSLDLIKIDVEGMQLDVLKGAQGIMSERHPAIWVEVLEKGIAVAETTGFMARFGYHPEKLAPNNYLFRV